MFAGPGQALPAADLIILPGSKNTREDLRWLRAQGWEQGLRRHLRYGGKIIGICGGLQMLGTGIADPLGLEGAPGVSEGLGLLDLETELRQEKRLAEVSGHCAFADAPVRGYEIHMGVSQGAALKLPAFMIEGRPEGARSGDDLILGTYLHGIFDTAEACSALLRWAGLESDVRLDLGELREKSLNRIADASAPLLAELMRLPGNPAMPQTWPLKVS